MVVVKEGLSLTFSKRKSKFTRGGVFLKNTVIR